MKLTSTMSFEYLYSYLHLNCIHRTFSGDVVSLIAVNAVQEFLHNFQDFVSCVSYAKEWYFRHLTNIFSSQKIFSFHPNVYKFALKGFFIDKKKILNYAWKEYISILQRSNVLEYFEKVFYEKWGIRFIK